ncbi:Atg14 domain-containing protein [Psychrobacter sp. I-STPA10]|uniref:Atg14 domain-containing protein n=1 Tax=Psychrobacter sp. I-STPA10 TaxID=2585769 RepID=UPI001E63CFA7|nr:Atg14 domain-containing protein [Psychrobacter sp. I-STPA10]
MTTHNFFNTFFDSCHQRAGWLLLLPLSLTALPAQAEAIEFGSASVVIDTAKAQQILQTAQQQVDSLPDTNDPTEMEARAVYLYTAEHYPLFTQQFMNIYADAVRAVSPNYSDEEMLRGSILALNERVRGEVSGHFYKQNILNAAQQAQIATGFVNVKDSQSDVIYQEYIAHAEAIEQSMLEEIAQRRENIAQRRENIAQRREHIRRNEEEIAQRRENIRRNEEITRRNEEEIAQRRENIRRNNRTIENIRKIKAMTGGADK